MAPKRVGSFDDTIRKLFSSLPPSYEQLVDQNQRYQNLPENLEIQTFFGQLRYTVVISIPKAKEHKTREHQNVCLALIRQIRAILLSMCCLPC